MTRSTASLQVYFPWDMGMLLFSELYSIGVPLFLPDRAWISSIIKRASVWTEQGMERMGDGGSQKATERWDRV